MFWRLIQLLTVAAFLLGGSGAFAVDGPYRDRYGWYLSSDGRNCTGGDHDPPKYTSETKADSYENTIATLGKEKFYKVLILAMKVWSPCPISKYDPVGFPESRMLATLFLDAALPITITRTDASEDCESGLPQTFLEGCQLHLYFRIENKTDDITFTYLAVACLGELTNQSRAWQLANVQYEPIKSSSDPLGPHETADFRMWYTIGQLRTRWSSAQIMKLGGVRWCHVISARGESLADSSKQRVPLEPLPEDYLRKKSE